MKSSSSFDSALKDQGHVSGARKLKILHTIRQGQIGGGETHVLDLVRHLDPAMFESSVISFTDGEMVHKMKESGVSCEVIHTEKAFDFRIWGKVERYISENNFDLIHAHGTRACSNTFWATNKQGLPLLYTVHGWSFHDSQPKLTRFLRQWSEKLLVNRTSGNILVSKSNQQQGIEKIQMPKSQVVYNGVDLQKFNCNNEYALTKSSLGLPPETPIVALIARLTVQKDPLTFIEAAKKVIESGTNAHFLIVGDGELGEKCVKLAKRLNVEDYITFAGFRTDIPQVLSVVDIYCLPSLWEGLPIGILEAMAMNKAVIATPADGSTELIADGKTGLLVERKNSDQLAQAIISLSEDLEYRKEISLNALKMVREQFSITTMTDQMAQVYKNLTVNKRDTSSNKASNLVSLV